MLVESGSRCSRLWVGVVIASGWRCSGVKVKVLWGSTRGHSYELRRGLDLYKTPAPLPRSSYRPNARRRSNRLSY